MFKIVYKTIKWDNVVSQFAIFLLAFYVAVFFIPQDSSGQFFSPWANMTSGSSGLFTTGLSSQGSFGFGAGLFGQMSIFSANSQMPIYGGSSMSLFGGFTSPLNTGGGYNPFLPQAGQSATSIGSAFGLFPTMLNSGFGQTIGSVPTIGWGNAGSVQSFGYGLPSGPFAGWGQGNTFSTSGGIQTNDYSRFPTSNLGVIQYPASTFNTGFAGGTNLWNWMPNTSGSITNTFQGAFNYPDIGVLPPVSGSGGGTGYVQNQILVKFHSNVTEHERKGIHDKYGAKELYTSSYGGFVVVEIPSNKTVNEMIEIYLKEDAVMSAEPNYIRHGRFVPNGRCLS